MIEYAMNTTFAWRGDLIGDIRDWCRQRSEPMVQFHCARQVPNVATGSLDIEERDGEMPLSFWNDLQMTHGWQYIETGRYKP